MKLSEQKEWEGEEREVEGGERGRGEREIREIIPKLDKQSEWS